MNKRMDENMISAFEKLENLVRYDKNSTYSIIAKKMLEEIHQNKEILCQKDLAKATFVSVSTISKFSVYLGYTGYKELFFEIKRELMNKRFINDPSALGSIDLINEVEEFIKKNNEKLTKLIHKIKKSKHIYIYRSFQTQLASEFLFESLIEFGKNVVIVKQEFHYYYKNQFTNEDALEIILLFGKDNYVFIENMNRNNEPPQRFLFTTDRHIEKINKIDDYINLTFEKESSHFLFRNIALQLIFFHIYKNYFN